MTIRKNITFLKEKKYQFFKEKLKDTVEIPKIQILSHVIIIYFQLVLKTKKLNLVVRDLFKKKIPVTINYKAISELTFYKKKYNIKDCKISRKWGNRTLSLPLHLKLSSNQLNYITSNLKNIISKYY